MAMIAGTEYWSNSVPMGFSLSSLKLLCCGISAVGQPEQDRLAKYGCKITKNCAVLVALIPRNAHVLERFRTRRTFSDDECQTRDARRPAAVSERARKERRRCTDAAKTPPSSENRTKKRMPRKRPYCKTEFAYRTRHAFCAVRRLKN